QSFVSGKQGVVMGALDAVSDWREKLLDLSKRNRLINCGTGKTGAVKLEHPPLAALWQSLVCESGRFTFAWRGELLDDNGGGDDDHLSFRPVGDEQASGLDDLRQAGALEATDHFDKYKASRFLAADHILTHLTDKALGRKLQRLALNAQTSLSE